MPNDNSVYGPLKSRTSSYDLCGSWTFGQSLLGSGAAPPAYTWSPASPHLNLVVLLCVQKAFWPKPYQVEQPVFLLLAKLDTSHSRQKGLDFDRNVRVRAEVTASFSASKALCSAFPPRPALWFPGECVEGVCDLREVTDGPPVEVHKS